MLIDVEQIILYQDNHLLILNKPAGLLTQPSGTSQDSLEGQAKQFIKDKLDKKGNVFLHAVHRLDKSVSGIVVFALTSKALARLNTSMRNRDLKKIYLAIVENNIPSKGVMEDSLIHDDFKATITAPTHSDAKYAKLTYEVLEYYNSNALVKIHLDTGRYHQIRIQFSSRGAPVAGDTKYGSKVKLKADHIALHHYQMEIIHPVAKEKMSFRADPPSYFEDLKK